MPRISFPIQKDVINIFELKYHARQEVHSCLLLVGSENSNNDELLTLPDGFEDQYGKTVLCDQYAEDIVDIKVALEEVNSSDDIEVVINIIEQLTGTSFRCFEIYEDGFEALLIVPDVDIHRSFYDSWDPVFEEDGLNTLCEITNV